MKAFTIVVENEADEEYVEEILRSIRDTLDGKAVIGGLGKRRRSSRAERKDRAVPPEAEPRLPG